MMSLINAVFITGLFSFWIWSLKQEINNLQRPAHDKHGDSEADTLPHGLADQPPHRNGSGVLTWKVG